MYFFNMCPPLPTPSHAPPMHLPLRWFVLSNETDLGEYRFLGTEEEHAQEFVSFLTW